MNFLQIKKINPQVPFYEISQEEFRYYGRVLTGYDIDPIVSYMKMETQIPEEGNFYIPSDSKLEKFPMFQQIKSDVFGEMPIEVGYCNGRNSTLNGMEYHKCSEVNVAASNLVLLLAKTYDIKDNSLNVEKIKAFFVSAGTAFEVFGSTLHFGPCKVQDSGFKLVVILTEGTNLPLKDIHKGKGENQLLFARNKWLLAHAEVKTLMGKGAYGGIMGENMKINY